jgi:hypothetical protein
MADRVFEAAAVDAPPPAFRWVLCALVLFFAPDVAAWTTATKEEARDEIWAGATRRLELLDELKALGEPDSAAAPRPSGTERQASPEVARRQAPPAPQDAGAPPNEAIDVSLTPASIRDGQILLLEQRVDADGDGLYEEIHWAEEDGGREVFRKHIDRDRDGRIDCWRKLRRGKIVGQILDTDFDGRPDVWEQYGAERTVSRQVDRDQDGVRDAFFYYQGDLLVMDAQDMDDDGSIDVRSFYEEGRLVRREVLNPELFF